jgi:putative transposase
MVVIIMNRTAQLFKIDNNSPEIQAVKGAIKKTKDKRMYQRYMVVLYHLKGHTNKDIANIIGLCKHTVGIFVNKYKANGLDGLGLSHSPGAPRKLTDEQEAKLVEVVSNYTPDEVGFANRKNWYADIVRQWVFDNFGVQYSYTGMIDLLHRLNMSYTRPTYTLAKADSQKQEEFKQEFELLKKPT